MPSLKCYRYDFTAMGCPCDIQIYTDTLSKSQTIAQRIIHDIQRLEAKYSRYQSTSFLSKINQIAADGGSINVDEETAKLLDYAAMCYAQSEGLFDITSGILRQVWSFKQQTVLPNAELIETLLARVGWQKLEWKAPRLTFLQTGMELDLGGIVKEYAADRAGALCQQMGIQHGAINLGGDIKIIGAHPDGQPWRIGIRHPRQPNGLLHSIDLTEGALASSGDYERCIIIEGVRYGHILNPKTGYPTAHLAAVTVSADFCVVAGSACTIAMLKEKQGIEWLDTLELPHCWVDTQGNVGGSLNVHDSLNSSL